MDIKQETLVFMLISLSCSVADSFEVRPLDPVTTTQEWMTASFPFVISPWPPDYRNTSSHIKYEHVELSFWNETQTAFGKELCRVVYEKGVLDEDIENCTQWDERMLPFQEATTTFAFEEAQFGTDQGQYRLLIEYGAPDVNTTTMLDVYVFPWAPNITKDPDEPYYTERDKVRLVCNGTNSNPPGDLEWTLGYYETLHPIYYHKAVDYFDQTSSIIEVEVRREHHGEAFMCWAHNEIEPGVRVSSSTSIYVQYPPDITLHPCNEEGMKYHVIEGYGATYRCEINANPAVTSTAWMRSYDGVNFEQIPGLDVNQTELMLFSQKRNDSAIYSCTSVNEVGVGNVPKCSLDIQYGPSVSTRDTLDVKEHGSVDITCTAESNPDPDTFKWVKEGDISFVHQGARFNISSAQPQDAGSYVCEASNTLTPTDSHSTKMTGRSTLQLHVLYSARLQPFALTKFTGHADQPAVIRCDVLAYPSPTFQWKLNGNVISSDSGRNITQVGESGVVHVYSVRDGDFGTYECLASNTEGTLNTPLSLLRPGPPDAPQSCTIHNETDYYATLLCVPGYDGGESLKSYVEASYEENGKRWDVSSSVTWTTGERPMVIRVEDLEPVTSYVLFIHGDNKHGTSNGFLKMDVTTIDGPGSPHPGDTGPTVGLIIGVTMGVLFLLAILVGLGLLVLWRVGLEPSCAKTAQERADMPYTTLARKGLMEGESGHQNEGFTTEFNDSETTKQNEYVLAPGVHREEQTRHQSDTHSSLDNRANEAYELRKKQSHLAGMGALSYNSNQNLTYQNQAAGPDVRPKHSPPRTSKERPPTIGAPAETDVWEIPRHNVVMRNKLHCF